jgi:hypothetical protein
MKDEEREREKSIPKGEGKWLFAPRERKTEIRENFLLNECLFLKCILIFSKCQCHLPVRIKNILPRNIIRKD